MTCHTHFAQIFTVFGNFLLEGDYVRTHDSHFACQARSRARKAALSDAFRATVRL
jgi:hypothetical protein